jgi:hypothetical protein
MPTGSFFVSDGSGTLTILDNATVSRSVGVATTTWLRVTNISLGLTTLQHTFSDDLDFLILGPDGRNLEFWSDAGGASTINGSYVISDLGASLLSDTTANAPTTYRPTDHAGTGGPETSSNWSGVASIPINHPAPTGSATFASAFGGAWLPDTTWTLKIRDDVAGFAGSLAAWSITFDYRVIVKPHDFDGGFNSDILWQNSDGTPGMWLMSGFSATAVGGVGPHGPFPYNPGPSWHIKAAGDFNDDGRSDILWQGDDGTPAIWLMNGMASISTGAAGSFNPGPSWHIKAAADFNFDGKSDILWQGDDGTPAIWLMNGLSALATGAVGPFNPGPSWQIKGTGDFNGDGRSDILWQSTDGTPAIWLMNGMSFITGGAAGPFNPGPDWQIKGTGDFNNDGMSDILWQNTNGQAAIWLMNGVNATALGAVGPFNPGPSWHVKGTGDYDGDLRSDILWQADDGTAAIWLMNGLSFVAGGAAGSFNPGSDWHVIG